MGSRFQKDTIDAVDNISDTDRVKKKNRSFLLFVSCFVDKLKHNDLGTKKQL